jgi:hypothetical protein
VALVARRRPDLGVPQRTHSGVLDAVSAGAGDLVRSVAEEVVPPVVDALDVDALARRIDVDALLARIDLDALVERIDVTRLVERLDVDAILETVDLDAVLARVDVDALLARTELGAVASRSASAVAVRMLVVVRSQGVGLDGFIERWTDRLLRRKQPPAHATRAPNLPAAPAAGSPP